MLKMTNIFIKTTIKVLQTKTKSLYIYKLYNVQQTYALQSTTNQQNLKPEFKSNKILFKKQNKYLLSLTTKERKIKNT